MVIAVHGVAFVGAEGGGRSRYIADEGWHGAGSMKS